MTTNSLNNFSENLTEILGPFLGTIIVKFFGVIPAFIIDSLTFFNALLIAKSFIFEEEIVERKIQINSFILSFYKDIKDAIEFLIKEGKYVNYILITEFLTLLASGTINNLLSVLQKMLLILLRLFMVTYFLREV